MRRAGGSLNTTRLIGAGILAGVFCVLLILERRRPLRTRRCAVASRLRVNVALSALALLAGGLAVAPVAQRLIPWAAERRWGLLNLVHGPAWAHMAAGFLLLDLSFYYWHRVNHVIPLLWRFHNAHHVDPDLDVTTSFRFHFGEVLYSAGFRAAQVTLLGVTLPTYLAYEAVFQCGTMFHHSNLRLPLGLERWLNRVFVTPRMHGVHHSVVRRETDSNYSVVFSWWDAIHRSLRLNVPQGDIVIGVPAYGQEESRSVWRVLAMPFTRQRTYWRFPDGRVPTRSENETGPSRGTMKE